MLGRLRLGSQNLRGRKFPEPPHAYRNEFQRDSDRILHSRAFRRLEGKTQVFAVGLGDHFRNRLTHTLEVAQVARTISSRLQLNEDFAETLALAHDLGHPPFAHAGEKELDRLMREFGSSFEHNRHALRIVDELEQRYARFPGLNLTFEVREGIVKHSRELGTDCEPEHQQLLPGLRPPLEAQLLDLADEIAYNPADIDDAFSLDLLSWEDLAEGIPAFGELAEQALTQFPGASDRVRFWEVQRHLMSALIGGLIEGTVEAAEASGAETPEDVRLLDCRIARMTPLAAQISRQMKALLINRVFASPALMESRATAVTKVGELFTFLVDRPQHLSPGYRERLESQPVHQVVCDYIAGMTDGFFWKTYKGLFGPP